MYNYLTEQPEQNKPLTFNVCGKTYEGTFDGINFRTPTEAFSVLKYTIDWQYK